MARLKDMYKADVAPALMKKFSYNDYYYLMIIGSYGSWFRREVCYRSKKLYDSKASDWEAQLIFESDSKIASWYQVALLAT